MATELDRLSAKGFNRSASLLDLDTGRKYELPSKEVFTIGRKDSVDSNCKADIQIETKDKHMHRTHIEIKREEREGGCVYYVRVISKNPIIIDGIILKKDEEPHPLVKNQVIRFPYAKLRIVEST